MLSEREAEAELGGEGDADGRPRAEEIAESARGNAQLIRAGDRLHRGARRRIQAQRGDIREAVHRSGQRGDVGDVVRARIIPVEKIEKFDVRQQRIAVAEFEGAGDAQVGLNVRRAAKLVERSLDTVDDGAIVDDVTEAVDVHGRGEREGPRAFKLRERGDFESARSMKRAAENGAVANVLAGGAVVSSAEGVEGIADSIDIIEKLAEDAAPGVGGGKRVVEDKIEALRHAALQMDGERVVARAIVGAEDVDVGDVARISGNGGIQSEAGEIGIATIGMDALLVRPIGADEPADIEDIFNAGGGVKGVRSFVTGIDERAPAASGNAARIARIDAHARRRVHSLERGDPAVLREVVVEEADTRAHDGAILAIERIGNAEARRDGGAIIMRRARFREERNLQSRKSGERGIGELRLAGGGEE